MKRRTFCTTISGQTFALAAAPVVWAMGEKRNGENYGISSSRRKAVKKIGKRSLEEIRDLFKHELYDKTIPLWKKDGVDWEYGGYLTSLPVKRSDTAGWPYRDAKNLQKVMAISTNKKLYHQGRILWLFSYLYTHIEKD